MMARFCRYVEKVFDWSAQLESLRDSRAKPQIPTPSVFLSALMMFAARLGSVNALEAELRVPKRWDGVVGKRKPSADSMCLTSDTSLHPGRLGGLNTLPAARSTGPAQPIPIR